MQELLFTTLVTDIYVNFALTPGRVSLLYEIRMLKKSLGEGGGEEERRREGKARVAKAWFFYTMTRM